MFANSRSVHSSQSHIHERLIERVEKNFHTPFLKPYAEHNLIAFETAQSWLATRGQNRPLIFDSGCGVGQSTIHLARTHPDALVIGIDRSEHRLSRTATQLPDNLLYLRADLVDFWRLAADHEWRLAQHYLLYPNPYPKSAHLQRRWYASPLFKTLLALCGVLSVRSNWQLYVQEFECALNWAGYPSEIDVVDSKNPITAFERKYLESGQRCWQCKANLTNRSV